MGGTHSQFSTHAGLPSAQISCMRVNNCFLIHRATEVHDEGTVTKLRPIKMNTVLYYPNAPDTNNVSA